MKRKHWLVGPAGLMLLASGANCAQPQSNYSGQIVVKAGDTVGGVKLDPSYPNFSVGGLNDHGELVFYAVNAAGEGIMIDDNAGRFTTVATEGDTIGDVVLAHFQPGGLGPTNGGQTVFLGRDANDNHLLFQYAAGKISLIAAPGKAAPGGQWAANLRIATPVSMNGLGSVAFSAQAGDGKYAGVYLWDAQKQHVTPVAVRGMTLNGVKLQFASSGDPPAINNRGDMVVNVYGTYANSPAKSFYGMLFIGADGRVQPIIASQQKLPDGGTAGLASSPVLNDAGVVAFAVHRTDAKDACYLWDEKTGAMTPTGIVTGENAPGGGMFESFQVAALDPAGPRLLAVARLNSSSPGFYGGVYGWSDGALFAVEAPGQQAPDGGRFVRALPADRPHRREYCGVPNWLPERVQYHPELHPLEAILFALGGVVTCEEHEKKQDEQTQMQKKVYEIDDEVDTTPPKYLLTPLIGQGDQVNLPGSAQPLTVTDVGANQYGGQSGAMNSVGQSAVVANIEQVGQSVVLWAPPLH